MKAAEIRRLAQGHDRAALGAAMTALEEGEAPAIQVNGEDEGEMLTHLMLADRVLELVAGGAEQRAAFREVMQSVRGVLQNESGSTAQG